MYAQSLGIVFFLISLISEISFSEYPTENTVPVVAYLSQIGI